MGAVSLWAWAPRGKEIDIDITPITDEATLSLSHCNADAVATMQVFDNNDNLFVFYFDKVGLCAFA